MILVRHGQSEWNAVYSQTRIDPQIPDPPLTEIGRQQALEAADALAALAIERLLVSPYLRTLQTAEIIAGRLGLSLSIEPLAREQAAFSCDIGTPRSQLADRWPHISFDHVEEVWWPVERETEIELGHRCNRFRHAMRQLPDWQRVAVISHWGFIRGLTGIEARNGQLVRFDPHGDLGSVD